MKFTFSKILCIGILTTSWFISEVIAKSTNYYEILGVKKTSSQQDIKRAFRQLALKYHPDKNKDPGAEDKFKEIAKAYEVLSNETTRREYDSMGHTAYEGGQTGGGGGGFNNFNSHDFFQHFDQAFKMHTHSGEKRDSHGDNDFRFAGFDFSDIFDDDGDEDFFHHNFHNAHHQAHHQFAHAHHDFVQNQANDHFAQAQAHHKRAQDDIFDSFGDFEFQQFDNDDGNLFHTVQSSSSSFSSGEGQRCTTVTKRVGNMIQTHTECH